MAQPGDSEERGLIIQGIQLQGVFLQGIQLQGTKLQGMRLQGISLQGIKIQGVVLQGLKIQGVTLQGITLQGMKLQGTQLIDGETVERSGTDFIGSSFDLTVDGQDENANTVEVPLTLHIEDIYPSPDAETDDVLAYEISYSVDGSDELTPLCVDEYGTSWPAYVFEGYWDPETGDHIDEPDTISFSCHFGVVAKCALWGYRPWAESTDCDNKWSGKKKKGKHCKTVSLRDHHQACTRMARADYCGNGEPWTVNGTAIDIWDNLDPEIQVREANWDIEAEWTPDGAWCLNDIRQQGWKAEGLYPACGDSVKDQKRWKKRMARRSNKCGTLKNDDSLLVSSFDGDAWE
ncbi:MAG: pentapeptide repeat-containing protein [Myxococcales bacterium]|nr:pentapeptide repeat-containing protein [Myxococcales bacterium]